MKTNNSNGQYSNDTRLNAISFLWNQLSAYKNELYTTEEELTFDTRHIYNELDMLPEMFDVCTKLQKLAHQPVTQPGYKGALTNIMMEAMEVLQAAPN